ncbi:hypothetical protein [Nonomuraea rhodomycinica]|uniref:Uncharacterized protein n=1 Tax=Nonomuraea rhodomycinica TaxID=1712872 RepID=A0A7Y6IZQ3_9ACTN|nr:hypothetical protein [Nonomuraea rhodomycinica]NUW46898.1 hypothetical protein [Nonomuraea rhodomycinica]
MRDEVVDGGSGGGLDETASDEQVGLMVRDLHERGLAGDLAGVAAAAGGRSFRELEALGRPHVAAFSLPELVMRLEFAELIPDEDFEAAGVAPDEVAGVRGFALAWVEDVKLRRAEEGDTDVDDPDVPEID